MKSDALQLHGQPSGRRVDEPRVGPVEKAWLLECRAIVVTHSLCSQLCNLACALV